MWPFDKKQSGSKPGALIFKGPEEFFSYQCRYGETDIVVKRGIVSLVLDARIVAGAPTATHWNDDGSQTVTLKVASTDGGFITIAATPARAGQQALSPGDVVIWVPLKYLDTSALSELDPRMGWMGLIAAKVAPEIDPSMDSFEVIEHFA